MGTNRCILMFSGGRDSTLAALRLADRGFDPVLVTITSGHLFGLNAVRRRLAELRGVMPGGTQWMTVRQPHELRTDTSFYERTCLPCQHAYVVVAVATALSLAATHLAFGYAGYQSAWPEQTPLAVERLTTVAADLGLELLLPVYDLRSREDAVAELAARGMSTEALEQKCIRQVHNVALPDAQLKAQVALWEGAIRTSAAHLHLIETAAVSSGTLDEV